MRTSPFFEDKFTAMNLKRLIYGNLFISFVLVMFFIFLFKLSYTREGEWVVSEAPRRDFCMMVAKQLIEKKVSEKVMESGLYSLVTNDNYRALPFTGSEKVSAVWSNDNSCKVLIKDEIGLRSFNYVLNSDGSYPFYYQVEKIKEHELFEKGGH